MVSELPGEHLLVSGDIKNYSQVAFVSLKFREEGQAGEIHWKLLKWKWNLNLGLEEGRWRIR